MYDIRNKIAHGCSNTTVEEINNIAYSTTTRLYKASNRKIVG